MMRFESVVALFGDLDRGELQGWIERSWVRPEPQGEDFLFADIDVARVRLIHDLRRTMAVAEETVPLVLSLLDQVYQLRDALDRVAAALADQPDTVRHSMAEALHLRRK